MIRSTLIQHVLSRSPNLRRPGRWSALIGLLAILAIVGCSERVGRSQGTFRNVVLVSVDTLRADHLSCYGYHRKTSPFLDRVAAQGVLFENAVSPTSWTLPAHATMLTGLNPSTHRAVDARSAMSSSASTAAEVFQNAGFTTGAVVASWFVSRHYGFNRGFQWFEDFDSSLKSNRRKSVRASTVVDEATAWLQQHADERFFLFLHFYDPHYNYDPPSPFQEMFSTGYQGPRERYKRYHHYKRHPLPEARLEHEIALYDGEIRYVDSELERLWELLEKLGRASSTLLVVTSDHGEEFFERGAWGHAHTIFDEQVRIPLVVAGSNLVAGRRVASQVRLVDLMPTLLEGAGLDSPENLAGTSFWSLLSSQETSGDNALASRAALLETSRFDTNLIGFRRSGWKLISNLNSGEELLFELETDPGEELDLASTHVQEIETLRGQMLEAMLGSIPDRWVAEFAAEDAGPASGGIATDGRFLDARVRSGDGELIVEAGARRLTFELSPGAALELTVIPVDAQVTFRKTLAQDQAVPVVVHNSERPVTGKPLTSTAVAGDGWGEESRPSTPSLLVWVERLLSSGEEVHLDDETRERLKALGYIM